MEPGLLISGQSVSLNTLSGRLHIPFELKGMEHWFSAGGRFGTAKLIRKNRKYYLHIPVTLEAENRNILNHIVGIDLGVNHLAVSFDDEGNTRFFSGRTVTEHVRNRGKPCGYEGTYLTVWSRNAFYYRGFNRDTHCYRTSSFEIPVRHGLLGILPVPGDAGIQSCAVAVRSPCDRPEVHQPELSGLRKYDKGQP